MAQELADMILTQANALNEQFYRGAEIGREDVRRDVRVMLEEYDRALHDPHTTIPTRLHLAIEVLRTKHAKR